jgi:hypothetical protein
VHFIGERLAFGRYHHAGDKFLDDLSGGRGEGGREGEEEGGREEGREGGSEGGSQAL